MAAGSDATDLSGDGRIQCFRPLHLHFDAQMDGEHNMASNPDGDLVPGLGGPWAKWYAYPGRTIAIESKVHPGKFWQIDGGEVNCEGDGKGPGSRFFAVARDADKGIYSLKCLGVDPDAGDDGGCLGVDDDSGNKLCIAAAGGKGHYKIWALPGGSADDKVQLTGEDPFTGAPRDSVLVFESLMNGGTLMRSAEGVSNARGGFGAYGQHIVHAVDRIRLNNHAHEDKWLRIAEEDGEWVTDAKGNGKAGDCYFTPVSVGNGCIRLKSVPHKDKGPEPDRMHVGWHDEDRILPPTVTAEGKASHIKIVYTTA